MFSHLWFLPYQLYKHQIVIEAFARNIRMPKRPELLRVGAIARILPMPTTLSEAAKANKRPFS